MNKFFMQLGQRVMPSVRGLAFVGAVALAMLFCMLPTLEAAPVTFRFELEVTEIDDSNFLRGEYDFGTRFASIESVAIEFLMPSGLSGGVCSGSGCSFSSLFVELHNIEYIVDRPENSTLSLAPEGTELTLISQASPPSQPEQLARGFSYILPNRLTSALFQIEKWPSFLFSGQGAVTFQQKTVNSLSSLNFPDAPTIIRYGKPSSISFASLVVKATPVPEPTGLMLAANLLAIFILRSRAGRNEQIKKSAEFVAVDQEYTQKT